MLFSHKGIKCLCNTKTSLSLVVLKFEMQMILAFWHLNQLDILSLCNLEPRTSASVQDKPLFSICFVCNIIN